MTGDKKTFLLPLATCEARHLSLAMRLMTYNIENGGARGPLIAEVIAAANPDVALLNEADDERVVQWLAGRLAYQPLWARGSGDRHIALLSRLPVVEWRVYNKRPFTQAVLAVTLRVKTEDGRRGAEGEHGASVQLFGVHLMSYFMLLPYEFARWRTVRALLYIAQQEARGPHLLLGDFNAVMPGERADTKSFSANIQRQLQLQLRHQPRFALSPIVRAGYVDCFRHLHPHEAGWTWMPAAPSARLDYIFADPQLAQHLRACEVVTTPPAARASDHFPLVADFALPIA